MMEVSEPQAYWCSPQEAIEVLQKEVQRLRAENIKQAKQILDAAHLLLGVPVGTPAFEAHRILCGIPPEVK